MTKANQLILYKHHLNLSINGHNEDNRAKHLKYLNEILKSFPEFEVKEKPMVEIIKDEEGKVKELKPVTLPQNNVERSRALGKESGIKVVIKPKGKKK